MRPQLVMLLAVVPACQSRGAAAPPSAAGPAVSTRAPGVYADLASLGDSDVRGELVFVQKDGGVQLEGQISGLSLESFHGLHIHEQGDCSGDGSAAGPHFDPLGNPHGAIDAEASHLGDLGNVQTDSEGTAFVALFKPGARLDEGDASFLGRAVIVTQDADDLASQPTGNSGARLACGVIRAVP